MKNISELKTSVDGLMNEIEIEIMHGVLKHEFDPQTLKNEKLEATRREIRAKIYKLFLDAAAMHGKEV